MLKANSLFGIWAIIVLAIVSGIYTAIDINANPIPPIEFQDDAKNESINPQTFASTGSKQPLEVHDDVISKDTSSAQVVGMPVFRFPVVPGSTISGYFDHDQRSNFVVFFDGRRNASTQDGFFFSCPSVGMYDFVGCEDAVSGEGNCSNSRELWYDNHRGVDMEYSSGWHTGAVCDPSRFTGITSPVYAPAPGMVLFAGYDPYRPGNGWHIRIKHDLNRNGNYDDDNFRSIYLHFTSNALAVRAGQIVTEGQYLGLGGSTGYSSSPHLHFEIQKSNDYFQYTYWSVDPYGWQGQGSDPWPYQNVLLWKVLYDHELNLPMLLHQEPPCDTCGNSLVLNGNFEDGHSAWVEKGVEVIARINQGNLKVMPRSGSWLAWLGGRNNAEDELYQSFTFPEGSIGLVLNYAVWVDSQETTGVYDWMTIRLRDANGAFLKEIDSIDNTYAPRGQWKQRTINISDIANLAGQTLRLSIEAHTDNSAVTSFYLDDIVLQPR